MCLKIRLVLLQRWEGLPISIARFVGRTAGLDFCAKSVSGQTLSSSYHSETPEEEMSSIIQQALPSPCGSIEQEFLDAMDEDEPVTFEVIVSSFAFKTGAPDAANCVTDVRFLPDPRNLMIEAPELEDIDGAIEQFICARGCFDQFFEVLKDQAVSLITELKGRGSHRVHFAFGCTAGRHRSVFVAERLAAWLRDQLGEPYVRVHHREQSECTSPDQAHYCSSCSTSPSSSQPSSTGSVGPSFRCTYNPDNKCLHVEPDAFVSIQQPSRSFSTEDVGSVLASGLDGVKALRERRRRSVFNSV